MVGDFDGDSWPDLVVAGNPTLLWLNAKAAGLLDATQPRLPHGLAVSDLSQLGDLDAGGDLDAVVANRDRPLLLRNDGHGRFADFSADLPATATEVRDAALADFAGDGDLDITLAVYGLQNRLYINDGTGRFVDVTGARLPVDADRTEAVVFFAANI